MTLSLTSLRLSFHLCKTGIISFLLLALCRPFKERKQLLSLYRGQATDREGTLLPPSELGYGFEPSILPGI